MDHADRLSNNTENWMILDSSIDPRVPSVIQSCIWIGRLASRRLSTTTRRQGLENRGDYETLLTVFHSKPRLLAPIEIATALEMSPSGMTSRLDRLEARELVRRQPDPVDRRLLRVEITSKGEQVAVDIFADAYELQAQMLAVFKDEEKSDLQGLLKRLLRSVESAG